MTSSTLSDASMRARTVTPSFVVTVLVGTRPVNLGWPLLTGSPERGTVETALGGPDVDIDYKKMR